VSPPIHPLTSSQGAVFLINSCQRYFSCVPHHFGYLYKVAIIKIRISNFHNTTILNVQSGGGKPYSEVTAAFLPSSLGISHSFALLFSSRTPVSVCGTVFCFLSLETFLGSLLYFICPERTLNIFATLGILIKESGPDFPGQLPHVTNANPIMRKAY